MLNSMLQWLKKSSKPYAEWATFLGFIAACIGIFMAYGQLRTANAQLEQANDQRRWQNYNELNIRYAQLYENIPKDIASGCTGGFANIEPDTKRWVRQYFDLYSEEYWLFLNDLIPKEMWTHRIHGGVRVNLNNYPALVEGYRYWKEQGAFTHPVEFQPEVERAIVDAKQLPQKSQAAPLCGTDRSAPITALGGATR